MIDENEIKKLREQIAKETGDSEEKIGMEITEYNKLCLKVPEYDIGLVICESLVKNSIIIGKKLFDEPNGMRFYHANVVGTLLLIIKKCIPENEYENIIKILTKRLLK